MEIPINVALNEWFKEQKNYPHLGNCYEYGSPTLVLTDEEACRTIT